MPSTDRIYSFSQFLKTLASKKDLLKNWNVISQPNGGVCFYKLTADLHFTDVKFLVKIIVDKFLKLTLYFRDYQINSQEIGIQKLESWKALEEIMARFDRTWETEISERFHIQKALTHLVKIEKGEFLQKFQKQISNAKEELNSIVIHPDYKEIGCSEDITIYEQIPVEQSSDNENEFGMEDYDEENPENDEMEFIVDESEMVEDVEILNSSINDLGVCENCGEGEFDSLAIRILDISIKPI